MKKHVLISLSTAAVLLLAGCVDKQDSQADSDSPASAISTSATAKSTEPACQREASKSSSIDKKPLADRWEPWGKALRPVSQEFGGEKTGENGSPACFEHSPEGALFAAATYFGALFSQEEFHKLALDHVYPQGEGQKFYDAWLAAAGQDTYDEASSRDFKVKGYNLDSYSTEKAVVAIVLGVDSLPNRYLVLRFPLIWADGDWSINSTERSEKELYADLGELTTSLDGYTAWDPENSQQESPQASPGKTANSDPASASSPEQK